MKQEKEIKVISLNIKIGKKQIELSKEEAKKLFEALEDIFQKKIIREIHHDWYYHNYPYVVTCGSTNGTITLDNVNTGDTLIATNDIPYTLTADNTGNINCVIS